MKNNLQTQVIWLTGASSGIGEALAYEFCARGAQLILSARRADELERVRAKCIDPARVQILPLDVAALESIPAKAHAARALFGPIDLLVNNAGITQRGRVADTEMVALQRVFQVNFFGAVAMTKAVLPEMLERRAGHIVVVSSLMGKLAAPKYAAYTASKHALQGYFDCLRAEVAHSGIRVTTILPGFVQSEISKNSLDARGNISGKAAMSPNAMRADVAARKMANAIARGQAEYEFGGIERLAVPVRIYMPRVYRYAIKRIKHEAAMLTHTFEITDARREQRAPNFTLRATNGLDVTLYKFAGRKRAVLYFPVTADDAASQMYARNLAALRADWDDADAVFLPILSCETESAHTWADENARGYSVLMDTEGHVREKYFRTFEIEPTHALLVLLDVYCAPLVISHAPHATELMSPAELPKWLNVLVCACSE